MLLLPVWPPLPGCQGSPSSTYAVFPDCTDLPVCWGTPKPGYTCMTAPFSNCVNKAWGPIQACTGMTCAWYVSKPCRYPKPDWVLKTLNTQISTAAPKVALIRGSTHAELCQAHGITSDKALQAIRWGLPIVTFPGPLRREMRQALPLCHLSAVVCRCFTCPCWVLLASDCRALCWAARGQHACNGSPEQLNHLLKCCIICGPGVGWIQDSCWHSRA